MPSHTSARIAPGALALVRTPVAARTYKLAPAPSRQKDIYHGGKGQIAGTVTQFGTPDTPYSARVRLHRKTDGMLIREVWSAPDGTYSFDYINENIAYYVCAFDHQGNYNGVIKDNITPTVMP
jgi:hypothetical protein